MTDLVRDALDNAITYSDGDVETNDSGNPSLGDLVSRRLSRRSAVLGGAKATGAAVFGSAIVAACGEGNGPTASGLADGSMQVKASAGQIVSLDKLVPGAGSGASYTQSKGPAVEFLGAEGLAGSFIAPAVGEATEIQINVRKGSGSTGQKVIPTKVIVTPAELTFATVDKNFVDVVTVPSGYSVTVLTALGDPILAGVPEYANDGSDANFAGRIGDHGDALYYFGLGPNGQRADNSSRRGILAQNHENLTVTYLHPNGPTAAPRPASESLKEIEAHGVSFTEIVDKGKREWEFVKGGAFNRRITPNTPVQFTGPVAGTAWLVTKYSNDGTTGRGTINNCANGVTNWATLLTCEENWAGYFRRSGDDANRSAREVTALRRYGVSSSRGNYDWVTATPTADIFARWDARATSNVPADATKDYRNEPNQFGWVVEIDPYDPAAKPRKRTALGRFAHEGAWLGKVANGQRLAVYMGDDSRFEYFYKFVSAQAWHEGDANARDRLAIGDKYLDNGTLLVAKFNADGTGVWLPLIFGQVPPRAATSSDAQYVFQDQMDILVNTRLAADAVGATTMDRPEWTACNPETGEIYLTLTNNSRRTEAQVNTANPRFYTDPNGGTGNPNGHIIRIREDGNEPAALTFMWDIYLFGVDATDFASQGNQNISGLGQDNDFSSPDGMWFSRNQNPAGRVRPLLWIQTDDGAIADRTNNQMLAALPGYVGDGAEAVVRNPTSQQTTFVGKAPTAATLRRFLVGPKECEITGVDTTPDGRTLFVGIQHPGEDGSFSAPSSNWPQSQSGTTSGRPRSGVVAVTKDDGGVVGL